MQWEHLGPLPWKHLGPLPSARCQSDSAILVGTPFVLVQILLVVRLLFSAKVAAKAWTSPLGSKLLLGAANPAASKKAPMGKAFALLHLL